VTTGIETHLEHNYLESSHEAAAQASDSKGKQKLINDLSSIVIL